MTTLNPRDVRRAGLSLRELADRAAISYPRLWRASAGSRNLSAEEFTRVQRILVDEIARDLLQTA